MKTKLIFSLPLFLLLQNLNAQSQPRSLDGMNWLRQFIMPVQALQGAAADRFDVQSHLDSMHFETLSQAWEPSMRNYYFYDAANQKVKDSTIIWNTVTPGWMPQSQMFYRYNAQGQATHQAELYWNETNNAWGQDTSGTVNVYDDQDRLTEVYNNLFNPETGAWEPNSVERLVYDAAGKVIFRRVWLVNPDGSETPIARMELIYNGALLVADEAEFSFDGGESWQLFFAQQYVYDNGLLVEHIQQLSNGFELENSEKQVGTYNQNGQLVHKDIYAWDGQWHLYSRCDLFWSGASTGTNAPGRQPLARLQYANPYTGGNITAPELDASGEYQVSLQTMDGRTTQSLLVQGNQWKLNQPAMPGAYVMTVRKNGNTVAVSKLIAAQ